MGCATAIGGAVWEPFLEPVCWVGKFVQFFFVVLWNMMENTNGHPELYSYRLKRLEHRGH